MSFSNAQQIPDAVMECAKTGKKVAIELELTVKSKRRYREIIMNYQLDSKYSEVLYICLKRAIVEKILKLCPSGGSFSDGAFCSGKFLFFELEHLLNGSKKGRCLSKAKKNLDRKEVRI